MLLRRREARRGVEGSVVRRELSRARITRSRLLARWLPQLASSLGQAFPLFRCMLMFHCAIKF